jgi:uncharacterized membrane protein
MSRIPDTRLPARYFLVLGIITAFNLLILFIRNKAEGNVTYNFLMFNLFLAFLPLLFAVLTHLLLRKAHMIWLVAGSLIWLLFYPNAPYMISDLIHVNSTSNMVIYDTLIIFSFAVLAIFYGFFSLKIIHLCFKQRTGNRTANYLMLLAILISSAGIYLGRILRLNSWDLFTRPFEVAKTTVDHLLPVYENPETYAIIILFSGIQFMFLIMMRDVESTEAEVLIQSGIPG